MYRPPGWKNPYLQQDEKGDWVNSRTYEAGADAMLKDVNDALAPLGMSFEENGLYVPTRNPEGGN